MTIKAVQAVFFARYSISNWRMLYNRVSESGGYTKDALQLGTDRGDTLAGLFGLTRGAGQTKPIRYVWPTGESSGSTIRWSSDRWQLAWLAASKPVPWTVAPIVTDATCIVGNPDLDNATDADAEHARIVATGVQPWLVAVKLYGEEDQLHIRIYFESPPPGMQAKAVACLPQIVTSAIAALPPGDDSNTLVLPTVSAFKPRQPPRAPELVRQVQEALLREPNVLLVGPPGTGKTVALEDLQSIYDDPSPEGTVYFDTSKWDNNWSVKSATTRSEVLVFHPSYSYENFVAGLYPISSPHGISLEAKPGPLLCLSHWVGKGNRQALLVIDEFNRGSAAAIFGDCLSLLDKDKRNTPSSPGARITRPYLGQNMPVPSTFWDAPGTAEVFGDEVRLPSGVHIVAAMNSTDRSVAPIDAAMRRRFTVIRVGPDYEALAQHLGLAAGTVEFAFPPIEPLSGWQLDDISRLAVRLLRGVNARIEFCLGEDFELGHALLWHLTATNPIERLAQLSLLVDTKLLPTLRMTFVDQDEAFAAVLGVSDAARSVPGAPPPPSVIAYWKEAPQGLASIADKRLSIRSLSAMDGQEQLAALNGLL